MTKHEDSTVNKIIKALIDLDCKGPAVAADILSHVTNISDQEKAKVIQYFKDACNARH
jgi:hypothetical protein